MEVRASVRPPVALLNGQVVQGSGDALVGALTALLPLHSWLYWSATRSTSVVLVERSELASPDVAHVSLLPLDGSDAVSGLPPIRVEGEVAEQG